MTHRREFLRFLAGSPVLAAVGLNGHLLSDLASASPRRAATALSLLQQGLQSAPLIRAPSEALDVFDFEPVAKRNIPVAHWAYLASGTDDDSTIRANREGFDRWALRPRRLIDVHKIDAGVSLFGTRYPTPIVINPVGSQKAFHPLGEIAVARAAKAKDHLQVLSTVATTSIEDAIAARGATVWFQLYHQPDWARTKQIVERAERAGSAAVVYTVDLNSGSNRETMIRGGRRDKRTCSTVWMDCSSRITAAARKTRFARRSRVFPRSSRASPARYRSFATADFVAARTSSRRRPWAQRQSVSGDRTSGGSAPSARRASRRCSPCCALNWRW